MAVSDKTSPLRNQTALPPALHGYIEGYYGRLLEWDDRARLLHRLSSLGNGRYQIRLPRQKSRNLQHISYLSHS